MRPQTQLTLFEIPDAGPAEGTPGEADTRDPRQTRIGYGNGISLRLGDHELQLDPVRRSRVGIVSHAHIDHLSAGALMTPATRDIMEARTGSTDATTAEYDQQVEHAGFPLPVTLRNAGHVLGSAMVRVGDILYTGDMNPDGGLTCAPAQPEKCRILITEATYGRPEHRLPPKKEVLSDFVAWAEGVLRKRPVVVGGYAFGKAQELIAACNQADLPVVVTEEIGRISGVYRRHGVDLRYRTLSGEEEAKEGEGGKIPADLRGENHVLVVTKHALTSGESPLVRAYRRDLNAATAVASGWAHVHDLTRRHQLDAQFPVSDHASYERLMEFVGKCAPERVFTIFGSPEPLAKAIRKDLGIPAQALNTRTSRRSH